MSRDITESVAHEGKIAIGKIATSGSPAGLGDPTVRFVHYPGSQQLILWLPQPGHQGYELLIVTHDGDEIERTHVMCRLNGSVQILFDALAWAPGDYRIVITHEEGWRHEISLVKLPAGVEPPHQPAIPPLDTHPPERNAAGAIIYRDGFGEVIPDQDLELRAQVQRDVARRFVRRLEYEGNFRAGTIVYVDGERRIAFSHEMCGGEMKFSIDVPTSERWEQATGISLAEREEIIGFLAERVKIEQASSWRYEITNRSIDFY